jgi:predicted nucleic acid-binding protein
VKLLLDTAVLGLLCHPRKHEDTRQWLGEAVAVHELRVPEVADYELRRELLRIESRHGLQRLDELGRLLGYVPVTTADWRHAAELWASRRRHGRPTSGDDALDGDMILAAQALAQGASIVTTNVRHFAGLAPCLTWQDVPLSGQPPPSQTGPTKR